MYKNVLCFYHVSFCTGISGLYNQGLGCGDIRILIFVPRNNKLVLFSVQEYCMQFFQNWFIGE